MKRLWKATAAALAVAGLALAQEGPKPKSQKELDALLAIQNAATAEAKIAAVDELLTKFADTEFKSWALMNAAAAAQGANDYDKMIIYGERALEADPKNFQVMLMMSSGIAQRTREHDLDREEKLKRSEKLSNDALEAIKTATKPAQLTDEQWEAGKKDAMANAYEALGLAAMVRKNHEEAAKQFQLAIDTSANPEPTTMVRLAATYNQLKKPDEALAVLDKLKAIPDVHPQVNAVAQSARNEAIKLKGGTAPAN
jgi:tetratricopeptide (TPR) repeat protein